MIPILYKSTERGFASHGAGPLTEATACAVREELNGSYELSLTIPATSRHFAAIADRALILAKPNPHDRPQPFRIYSISKPVNKLVRVQARHWSYDLDGYPVWPFTANSLAAAEASLNSTPAQLGNPFTVRVTMPDAAGQLVNKVPTACRALLGGDRNSLLSVWGGELRYDLSVVYLAERRGADYGAEIAYGKNLVDLDQERNISEVYTAALPYYTDADGTLSGYLQPAPGTWDYNRVLPVDLSGEFDQRPTLEQLNAAGAAYVVREKIGRPKVSIKASFVPPGSRGLSSLSDLALGDTVRVRFEALGIAEESRVTAYNYDVLNERYDSVEIGERRETAAAAITDASRLTVGTIPSQRIGAASIRSSALENGAVTINKIQNGAVITEKLAPGAVTGNKVLDQAIEFAKLSNEVQVTFSEILATNKLFAGYIDVTNGSINGSVVTARNYISAGFTVWCQGIPYTPQTYTFVDGSGTTNRLSVLGQDYSQS